MARSNCACRPRDRGERVEGQRGAIAGGEVAVDIKHDVGGAGDVRADRAIRSAGGNDRRIGLQASIERIQRRNDGLTFTRRPDGEITQRSFWYDRDVDRVRDGVGWNAARVVALGERERAVGVAGDRWTAEGAISLASVDDAARRYGNKLQCQRHRINDLRKRAPAASVVAVAGIGGEDGIRAHSQRRRNALRCSWIQRHSGAAGDGCAVRGEAHGAGRRWRTCGRNSCGDE